MGQSDHRERDRLADRKGHGAKRPAKGAKKSSDRTMTPATRATGRKRKTAKKFLVRLWAMPSAPEAQWTRIRSRPKTTCWR